MKEITNQVKGGQPGQGKNYCLKCFLAIAIAEPTTASGDTHLRCAAMEAARELVKVGMQLNPSASFKELQNQLYKLLKTAINEQVAGATEDKAAVVQSAAVFLLGKPLDLAAIISEARIGHA